MASTHLKYFWLFFILLIFCQCDCGKKSGSKSLDTQETAISSNLPITPTTQSFYNLEAIDLAIEATDELGFSFNDQQLSREGDLYVSDDLIVYKNKENKWQATVISKGGISSHLKIFNGVTILKEVAIATKSEVFPYQDVLGPEWPGMHNIGNTCFANATYKLIARCPGFDQALSQDIPGGIHTSLRNIVNGIRLGNKSALHEAAINKKISEWFLKTLTTQNKSKNVYDNKKQNEPENVLRDIINLLYPSPANPLEIPIEQLINHAKANNPFLHILQFQEKTGLFIANLDVIYNTNGIDKDTSAITFSGFLATQLPKFLILQVNNYHNASKVSINELIKVPLHHYKTGKELALKTYQLMGLAHHIGSTNGGHYVAYNNFQAYGWYKQDDLQNPKVSPLDYINSHNIVFIYALQD